MANTDSHHTSGNIAGQHTTVNLEEAIVVTTPNASESPLLKLPGELQNHIYRMVVVKVGCTMISVSVSLATDGSPAKAQIPTVPALASVSRRLRDEVHPIYFE